MKLSIYSLKNVLFQGEALQLTCKTPLGEITVLDNHEPLISSLSAGPMKVVAKNGMEHLFPIKSGFLEVKPDNETRAVVEE